uniref:Urotensin II-related peptide n=1 Tax=Oncorhynchus tshawytscha TaxID=74940 RepID=A0AAZ3R611_ONCTS
MQNVSVVLLVGVLTVLVTLWAGVDTAPTLLTDRGDIKLTGPATGDSNVQERTEPSTVNASRPLKTTLMTTIPVGREKTSTPTSSLDRRLKMDPVTSSPDRRAQILKMLSVLEELSRAINSTLSTRMTMMPRGSANGRNSGKKKKAVAEADRVKTTTVPPVDVGGSVTASRPSTDGIDSLSGRNIKKSLPQQPKKPSNKRVCFWKYCSQN